LNVNQFHPNFQKVIGCFVQLNCLVRAAMLKKTEHLLFFIYFTLQKYYLQIY